MLKKQNKVNQFIFKDIIKKGISYYTQNISLKIIENQSTKPKFGVSVSKKEIKTAVKRNLLKRRTLSILRKVALKTKRSFSSVIFLKKGAINLPYPKLEDEVVFLLKKAKII